MLLISSRYVESPYIKQVVEKSLFKKLIKILKVNCFVLLRKTFYLKLHAHFRNML